MSRIIGVDAFVINLPLFRKFEVSFGALPYDHVMIRLRGDSGHSGWGDTGHLLTAYSGESVDSALACAKQLAALVLGRDPMAIGEICQRMDLAIHGNNQIKCAFDVAMHDLAARVCDVPLHKLLGGALTDRLETQLDISIGPIDQVLADVRRAIGFGVRSVGLKVGKPTSPSLEHDISTVAAVRKEFGPDLEIWIDGNGGYNRSEAVRAIRAMEPYDIGLFEQPVPGWDIDGIGRAF